MAVEVEQFHGLPSVNWSPAQPSVQFWPDRKAREAGEPGVEIPVQNQEKIHVR